MTITVLGRAAEILHPGALQLPCTVSGALTTSVAVRLTLLQASGVENLLSEGALLTGQDQEGLTKPEEWRRCSIDANPTPA